MLIYLAGVEQSDSIHVVQKGMVQNAFFSFYTMRNKDPKQLIMSRPLIKNIIVDSGAHSFFSELQGQGLSVSVHTKKTKTKETPDEYFAKYLSWVIKFQDYFDYFVELDIGEICGQAKVLKWREVLKEAGVFHKCITVYHPEIVTFEEYLQDIKNSESKYIALEGDRPSRSRLPYLKLLKPAYEAGVKVHGFAMTKLDVLKTYPFYSVDSTSWKAGVMYGTSLSIVNNKIRTINYKKHKGNVLSLVNKIDDVNEIHSEDKHIQRQKRFEISIKAFRALQDRTTQEWAKKGIIWQ